MTTPLQVRTLRTYQTPALGVGGTVTTVYRVEFMVGDHGPFTADFAPADFIPSKVRAEQEKIAATVRDI
jgi:hypothetical protein